MNHPRTALIALLSSLIACVALAVDYPLTITDALGREVTLEAAPERVVTMMPSHTETVCALDACDLLVGVDRHSDHPPEVADLPTFGTGFDPDVEAIVAAEPDLVLTDASTELPGTLADLGVTSYAGVPASYQEVFAQFEVTGQLLDREAEARDLARDVRDTVDAVASRVADREAPTVFYELDTTPYSVGPGSYIHTLIERAGGDNIVEEGMGAFPQVDPEFIVAQDPEVIVLADAPYGTTAETVAERTGWADVRAVQEGNVHELSESQVDMINRAGPRLGGAIELLARLFHPGAF